MKTVSIVNVTSYTALELLRLLSQHPDFRVNSVTGRSAVGKRLEDIFPQLGVVSLQHRQKRTIDPCMVITEAPVQTDLAFLCLPHAAAAEVAIQLLQRGIKVIDLSADFRLRDAAVYEQWYKHIHPAPALLQTAVYGLCEHYREQVRTATLIANPGCHSTASILALLPAVTAGIIGPHIIINSLTGISGGGRTPSLIYHYPEVNEDVCAYSLAGHRHLPEIVQELEGAAQAAGHAFTESLRLTFVPHMVPMTRGILATCYADVRPDEHGCLPTSEEIRSLYRHYYAEEPFVHIVEQSPHTKWSYGSNHCFVYPIVDERTRRLIVISCLDNLVKGASGQAIQNANLLCGLPEVTGLAGLGVSP